MQKRFKGNGHPKPDSFRNLVPKALWDQRPRKFNARDAPPSSFCIVLGLAPSGPSRLKSNSRVQVGRGPNAKVQKLGSAIRGASFRDPGNTTLSHSHNTTHNTTWSKLSGTSTTHGDGNIERRFFCRSLRRPHSHVSQKRCALQKARLAPTGGIWYRTKGCLLMQIPIGYRGSLAS